MADEVRTHSHVSWTTTRRRSYLCN